MTDVQTDTPVADTGVAQAPAPVADAPAPLSFNLADGPKETPITVTVDRARIPAAARLELLDMQVRSLINGRPHQAAMKYAKAKAEYEAKCAADPTFEGEAPVAPNLAEIATAALNDLYEGKIRQRNRGGAAKEREAKDPVDAVVTQAVIRELFAKRKTEKPGTKYQEVVKEVGASGIEYLNNRAKELAGSDTKRLADLQKTIDSKYVAPARKMVSLNAKGEAQENELL